MIIDKMYILISSLINGQKTHQPYQYKTNEKGSVSLWDFLSPLSSELCPINCNIIYYFISRQQVNCYEPRVRKPDTNSCQQMILVEINLLKDLMHVLYLQFSYTYILFRVIWLTECICVSIPHLIHAWSSPRLYEYSTRQLFTLEEFIDKNPILRGSLTSDRKKKT